MIKLPASIDKVAGCEESSRYYVKYELFCIGMLVSDFTADW